MLQQQILLYKNNLSLSQVGFDSPLGYQQKQIMSATKGYIQLLFLLAAGLLAGCSDTNVPEQKKQQTEIALITGVTGMQRRAATIDNNTALQGYDLKIDAYFHGTYTKYLEDTKLHYTGGDPAWVFWDGSEQEHYYWPFDGAVYDPSGANITYTSLDFVGLCPFTKPAYIGTSTYDYATGVSFACDMSSYMTLAEQETMQEYLVAVLNSQTLATQTAAGGSLPLQFKHPLAQIKFVITAASGTHVQIDSISIPGLYTGGSCRYDGTTLSWSDFSGSAAMSQDELDLKYGTAKTETTPFFVIPNNYGTKYLTVKATWDDWDDVTIRNYGTNVNFNWEPGHIYVYNLTLDKYALKVDIQKYTEQW